MFRLQRRSGFTLAEVAVAAVLVAILAAVTTPALNSFLQKQKAQTAADKLSAIATGIAAFKAAVHTTTAATSVAYPGRISYLANAITAGGFTSCHTTFTATAVTSWNSNGPFVSFYIPADSFMTPLGMVQDSITRTPTGTGVGTLAVRMLAVDSLDAIDLDQVVDGGDGQSKGTVQWTWVVSGSTHVANVNYLVPHASTC